MPVLVTSVLPVMRPRPGKCLTVGAIPAARVPRTNAAAYLALVWGEPGAKSRR